LAKNLNILHLVQEYAPAIGGMSEVVKQLSERLVSMGHSVTVATGINTERKSDIINGVKIISFSITGNYVMGYKGNTKEYEDFLLNSKFDVVTLFAAQQWATDIALPILTKIQGKKVFVPTGFSYFYNPIYSSYYEKMKVWMKQFDANVFLSNDYRDINFAKENSITKNYLIPNGAAEEEFDKPIEIDIRKKLNIPENSFLILHVGSFTGAKGQPEAVKIFLKANIPNAVLLLAGHKNNLFRKLFTSHYRFILLNLKKIFKRKKIIITELNRQETIDAYKTADLFLFPSNIECSPIVLFECMAAKIPFASSDVGNAKEIAQWGGNGFILPTEKDEIEWGKIKIDESAKMLEEIVSDKETLNQMAKNGYKAWKNSYTWQKIAQQYEKLYLSLSQTD